MPDLTGGTKEGVNRREWYTPPVFSLIITHVNNHTLHSRPAANPNLFCAYLTT